MKVKFYRFAIQRCHERTGVLYTPPTWPYPIEQDGEEVKNWKSLVVELKGGEYCPFHFCIGGAKMVNEELKNLLESFVKIASDIEFLPVKVISPEYGDRIYYIMHFKKIFDVIDSEHTLYVEQTGDIAKLRLAYDKVKNLHVFNSQATIYDAVVSKYDIIVSEEVRNTIKKNKLDSGLDFIPVYCGDSISMNFIISMSFDKKLVPCHKDAINRFEEILKSGLGELFQSDIIETFSVRLICLSPEFSRFVELFRPKYYADKTLRCRGSVTPYVRLYKHLEADFVLDFDTYIRATSEEECLKILTRSFITWLETLKYPIALKKFEKEKFNQCVKDILKEFLS